MIFNFRRIRPLCARLNGTICLIRGNHDKKRLKKLGSVPFAWVKDYYELRPGVHVKHIVLCHYAMRVWNRSHHGSWMLYGHSHGSLADDPNALNMDVGVDPNGYSPVSIDEVAYRMAKKKFVPVDHHNARVEAVSV